MTAGDSDYAERVVWMDTIEAGTVLQWEFYRDHPAVMAPEWVTVISARSDGEIVWAIVVREDGEQDMVSYKACMPVRIRVPIPCDQDA